MSRRWGLSLAVWTALAAGAVADDKATSTASDKRALAPLQAYVGAWRGVGLPRRGSNAGAWRETFQWAWRFGAGRAELVAEIRDGKYYDELQLRPGEDPGQFVLLASRADAEAAAPPERFTGTLDDGRLRLTARQAADSRPARISLRLVAGGDRMLVLYEKQIAPEVYARLAEVGATREGSSFAKNAASGPECVVTGGLGTIAVEHDGKKYYVCCGGCRDLFLEDPAGVLAEYRERKAAERKDGDAK